MVADKAIDELVDLVVAYEAINELIELVVAYEAIDELVERVMANEAIDELVKLMVADKAIDELVELVVVGRWGHFDWQGNCGWQGWSQQGHLIFPLLLLLPHKICRNLLER